MIIQPYPSERINKDGKRYYKTLHGTFPSVTTILEATHDERKEKALQDWRDRIGYEESERVRITAAERGTALHEAIEYYLLENRRKIKKIARPYWKHFYPVLKEISDVELIESVVWNPTVGYAGTADCAATFRGKACLIDWKTANKTKPPHFLDDYKCQLAAYFVGVYQTYSLSLDIGYIMIAIENDKPQIISIDKPELKRYYEIFKRRVEQFYNRTEY